MVEILHNPRCGKSRNTLKILEELGVEITITEYLKNSPDEKKLKEIIRKLGISAHDLIRKNEELYKAYKGKNLSEDECLKLMVKNPILIERPIVIKGGKAIIGRPPENVNQLF